MTSGGPDLFVVCKQCRSEVSPYITECPYCGARLRKRAPKLDREGRVQKPKVRRNRRPSPSLGRLRTGEIPGIRGDSRLLVTPLIILVSLVMMLLWRTTLGFVDDVGIIGNPGDEWWRVFTAPFVYDNSGYALAVLGSVGLFGWLLERRHGPAVVAVVFLLGASGGMLLAVAAETIPFALGANGGALALLVAWAIPDLRDLRRGEEVEGDLLGVAVIFVVLLVMPAFVSEADWLCGLAGVGAGVLVGLPLSRLAR